MKKTLLSLLAIIALSGCSSSIRGESHAGAESVDYFTSESSTSSTTTITSIDEPTVTGDFKIETTDGLYANNNGVYTISTAGTYVLSGSLSNGYIYVNAGDDDEVNLELNDVSITSSKNSPIFVYNASKVKVKANSDTENLLKDTRSVKTTDNESQGEGVISAKCDLSLTGNGTLVISGTYNNGVHTTKDLSVKNQTLQVTAYNNALKGNDSVTIESGSVNLVSKSGDGIKTDNTDVSSKSVQRGTVTINDGTVQVNASEDAIDAAYNFEINGGSLNALSGKYSSNPKSSYTNISAKGIKAENQITFNNGTVNIKSSDDAIHADYGTSLENGKKGIGTVVVNGGSITLYATDDGVHADKQLDITGGTLVVSQASEGIEANIINISGGSTKIYGTDDGVNAALKKDKGITTTPQINITGGLLDVSVGSGDTDGIDSNGNYTQSGGIVITRGPSNSNMNMSAIDADGTSKVTGGTLIALGALGTSPTLANTVYKFTYGSSSGGSQGGGGGGRPGHLLDASSLSTGNYKLGLDNNTIEFYLENQQLGISVFTNDVTNGKTYTLYLGTNVVTSWTASK